MLVILGYAMVLTFMVLIMTKRMSPMLALIIVPSSDCSRGRVWDSATW